MFVSVFPGGIERILEMVTVHSVHSNTLRDAQKLQKTQFRAAKLGIFTQKPRKTPCGTVTSEQ